MPGLSMLRRPTRSRHTRSLKAPVTTRPGRGLTDRAGGVVRQCRGFARSCSNIHGGAKVGGYAGVLLAAPFRSRHAHHAADERSRHRRLYRRRLFAGRRILREPYFYVSVYPEPDPVTLPMLPEMGHWHTHEFTAGVKLAHTILATKNMAAETDNFLQGAVAVALKLVSKASH